MNELTWSVVVIALVALVGCNVQTSSGPSEPASQPAAVGAEAYYQWLTGCLDAIEKDLPKYTRSAEAAAELYVKDGCEIADYGGDPFAREIFGRSGGMMKMMTFDEALLGKKLAPELEKAVVLVGLRDDGVDKAAEKIAEFKKKGYYVVVFGRAALLARVRATGALADAEFDTHAAPEGGLFQDAKGQWIIPTDSAAASAASWMWMGEFVAACTRQGKMPVMYLGYAVEGAMEREARYKGVKFHDKLPSRLEVGQLSKQWMSSLRKSLASMHASDMPQIRRAAAEAKEARAAGHKLWAYLQGHVTLKLLPYPHDPQWFEPIHRDWATLRKDATVGKGDFVLCIGFNQVFAGKDWGNFAENSRAAGAKLAWSFTDYMPEQVRAVPAGEIYINQHWDKGDAVALVPNYDIQCLPTSGVIAEAVLWMVHAEILSTNDTNCTKGNSK